MSGYSRLIDSLRDEGIDAYYNNVPRDGSPYSDFNNPLYDTDKIVYWVEGWDYASDVENSVTWDSNEVVDV